MMVSTKKGLKVKDFGKFNSQDNSKPFTFKGKVKTSKGVWEHAEWTQEGECTSHEGEEFFIGRSKHIPTTKEEFFNFSMDGKLERAFFFINADSFSQFELWRKNKKEEGEYKLEWVQDSMGFAQKVGSIYRKKEGEYEEMPVMVSLSFALLNDVYVCFYTSDSMVTDWKMVEEFIEQYAGQYDSASRRAMTNSDNFSHCNHYCRENH